MKEDFKCRKYFLQTLEKVLIYTHQCKIDLTMHTINANCKYFLQQLASFSVLIILIAASQWCYQYNLFFIVIKDLMKIYTFANCFTVDFHIFNKNFIYYFCLQINMYYTTFITAICIFIYTYCITIWYHSW